MDKKAPVILKEDYIVINPDKGLLLVTVVVENGHKNEAVCVTVKKEDLRMAIEQGGVIFSHGRKLSFEAIGDIAFIVRAESKEKSLSVCVAKKKFQCPDVKNLLE